MPMKCIACKQPTTEEQPYYCQQCFIPVPPYIDGDYIGTSTAYCSNCDTKLDNRDKCDACKVTFDLSHPPKSGQLNQQMQIRKNNRERLAQEVLEDSRMTKQVIEMLGIDHLPRDQQGVALTALANEKMNFLSVEYNFKEAHTLVDMGYGITQEVDKQWAQHIAGMRLAVIYYRLGIPMHATELLHKIYQQSPETSRIERYRKLEVLAHLALTHRLAGNKNIADEAAKLAHEKLLEMYQEIEVQIQELQSSGKEVSDFMGMDESGAKYPRIDYIFTILVILTEESIARGAKGELNLGGIVLDRILELNNIIDIIGKITPRDDPGYFAAHLREFVRLFNGLFWYGDLLLPNSGNRRRYIIEQAFERIKQWQDIVPNQYWLPLRPARFLEIFLRSQTWSEIEGNALINAFFEGAKKEFKPSWHYIIAEAKSRTGELQEAMTHLQVIRQEREAYIHYADDQLKSIANQLYNAIQLEAIGILYGIQTPPTRLEFPCEIILDQSDPTDVKKYLDPDTKQPEHLKVVLDDANPLVKQGVGLFGDKLLELYSTNPIIHQVDNRKYSADSWHTPSGRDNLRIEGQRMDIVLIKTKYDGRIMYLLFEGKEQDYRYENEILIIQPSPLLYLRAIGYDSELDYDEFINLLGNIMAGDEFVQDITEVLTIKKD